MSEEEPQAQPIVPRLMSGVKKLGSRLKELWSRPRVRFGTTLFVAGALVGTIAVGTTAKVVEATNTTEFCVGCHVYEEFYEEFKGTSHHRNAAGVIAECGDCHIPHDNWFDTLTAKAASGFSDVFAYTLGGVNTPEKFEARRAVLAREVWEKYERTDSRYCRYCHEPAAWDLSEQTAAARGAHQSVLEGDGTCIDCHKGIAHEIPEGARTASAQSDGREPGAAGDGAAGGAATAGDGATADGGGPDGGGPDGAGDGARLFEPCAQCHGPMAPGPVELAALSESEFMKALDLHMNVGGRVSDLTDEERKTIYRYLESQ